MSVFFHTKSYCFKPFRCMNCTGSHDTALCTKPKNSPAVCVNCNLNHPANYRGCATYKEIQKLRAKQYNKLIEYINKQPIITSPHPPIPPSLIFLRCCANLKKYIIDQNLIYLGYLNHKTSTRKLVGLF